MRVSRVTSALSVSLLSLTGLVALTGPSAPALAAVGARHAMSQPNNSAYRPLLSKRILDTRTGNGAAQAPIAAGGTLTLQVTGRGGVPAGGVTAVALNVTAAKPTASGYLTAYPTGAARPGSSNVNFRPAATTANLAVVPVGSSGQVDIFNGSSAATQVVADVTGYYATDPTGHAGDLVPVGPTRVYDSRTGSGQPVAGHGLAGVPVAGAGVPPGASSVLINLTVTRPQAAGYLTAYRPESGRPAVSTLNYVKGQTVANLVTVPLGASGAVDVYVGSTGGAHIVVDVEGYTTSGATTASGSFVPVPPARIYDTRRSSLAVPASHPLDIDPIAGFGVPSSGVEAVVLNLTAVNGTRGGYVSAYPKGYARPATSVLNYPVASAQANLVVVPVSEGYGWITLFNGSTGSVQLIVDLEGYLVAPSVDWQAASPVVDPPHGTILPISCATKTFCVAVDSAGTATTFDGVTWSRSSTIDSGHQLEDVSCPAAGYCVAIDDGGYVVALDGSGWGTRQSDHVGFGQGQNVSCPTTTFCALGGQQGGVAVGFGSTWTPAELSPGQRLFVSCASASFCLAVDTAGKAYAYDGSAWSAAEAADSTGFTSVACPSANVCLATDAAGRVLTRSNGAWASPVVVSPHGLYWIRCPATTTCFAADTSKVYGFDGSTWSTSFVLTGNLGRLGCASPTWCQLTLGFGSVSTYDNGTWSPQVRTQAANALYSVSCASASFCLAGDQEGVTFAYDGADWSGPQRADASTPTFPPSIQSLSCPTDQFCMAGDNAGPARALSRTDSVWSAPAVLTPNPGGSAAISCVSAAFCEAVRDNQSWNYDNGTWSGPLAVGTTGATTFLGVSCVSTTYCLSTSFDRNWRSFNGTAWSAPSPTNTANPLGWLTCVSPTFCAAAMGAPVASNTHQVQVFMFDGITWTPGPVLPGGLNGLSCVSVSLCVGVQLTGGTVVYDGATWLGPAPGPVTLPSPNPGLGPVSCGSDGGCAAVIGLTGNLVTGTAR